MKTTITQKNLTRALILSLTANLVACGGDDNNEEEARQAARIEAQRVAEQTAKETAQNVAENTAQQLIESALKAMPQGLGYEQYIAIPRVNAPLPAVTYLPSNDGNGRFYLSSNSINYALRGINDIWQGTTDFWQENAGDFTDAANGYKAGDGPNPHNAANGQPSDYVEAGTEIVDAETWKANIQYVINATANRTEEQTLYAFLDDIRSKNYGTIDGFGPLTEDYAEHSGAFAKFEKIFITDVTENNRYAQPDNDSYTTYGGQTDSALGSMVQLAKRFRDSFASTSGPKYLFGTPRPWRMNENGELQFQGVDALDCVDGASATRETKTYRIDNYISTVNIIPGLYCGRRAHSAGDEADKLYTAETENRRKDNGYPSGHTNAGILASLAYAYALPERYAEHVARGSDLGENRILAGMHSPVDIIGGRMQALMVATYALNAFPEDANAAFQQAREYFGVKAAQAGMSLYDYAHQNVENEGSVKNSDGTLNVNVFNNNRFSDHQATKEAYAFRMTYGLPQKGTKGLAPIVPEGAEALLKTRFPYLSDAQRRAVLATTEVDSGYPLLDASNDWGRINLVAAADGYGAFDGDVYITMQRSQGGFSAHDWWRNDISGAGLLQKDGTGQLTLTGNNTYTGGTLIKGGILEAESPTAFGAGDVYLAGGEIEIDATGPLAITGNYTQKSGVMTVLLDNDSTQISVTGKAIIYQGELTLDASQRDLTAGNSFTILTAAGGVTGEFKRVTLLDSNLSASLSYTNSEVIVTISE